MNEYTLATKFIDLNKQQKLIREKIDSSISNVLDHGNYIMGPEVKVFEKKLSEFVGSKYSLTCANGTDALTISLMAWGVKEGDAVFVPSLHMLLLLKLQLSWELHLFLWTLKKRLLI